MKNQFILFDGNCGFCNKTIMFIAKKDTKNSFTFVSSNAVFGDFLLTKYKLKGLETSTLILVENKNNFYTKSTAIRKIFLQLPYYKIIGYSMFLFPKKLCDYIYSLVSKNRTLIIKNTTCEIPSSEIKKKFVM